MAVISDFTYPVTSACWTPDGASVVIGSHDTDRALSMWSAEGEEVYKAPEKDYRVNDLAVTPNGQRLVVLLENRIVIFDFASWIKLSEMVIDGVHLTSLNISQDSEHMLVSMNPNRLRLIHISSCRIVQKYFGQVQTHFVIRSAFGGANESFVVSGGEGKFPAAIRLCQPLTPLTRLSHFDMAEKRYACL